MSRAAAWLLALAPHAAPAQQAPPAPGAPGAPDAPLASDAPDAPDAPDADLDAAWAALDAADPATFAERRAELIAAGGARAALRGLDTFARATPAGRRVRASLALEHGDAACVPAALALLSDPDAAVRRDLVAFLGERHLLRAHAAERVAALAQRVELDADAEVRAAAIDALAAIDDPGALARLDLLLDQVGGEDRARVAARLAAHAGARERLVQRVVRAFGAGDGDARPLDPATLAVLLEAYGDALVHLPGGGEAALERRPILLGRLDPSAIVRLAARAALDGLIAGLALGGEVERADSILVALGEEGLAAREVAYRRAEVALVSAADPKPARALAAELLATTRGRDGAVDREWRVRGALLAAAAEVACDAPAAAERFVDEALATLDGLAAERPELLPTPRYPARENVDRAAGFAHLACTAELWRAVARLAAGAPPDDARLLADLRRLHVRQLEAQVAAAAEGARVDLGGLQPLFDEPLGPVRLLLSNRDSRAWPAARALALLTDLGRALAGVAAFEMPGFEPASDVEALRDPIADPERRRLLLAVLEASLAGVSKEAREERGRARPDEDKLLRLQLQAATYQNDLQSLGRGRDGPLRRGRTPSDLAYELAIALLGDGNPEDARALALRMKDDLFAAAAAGGAGVPEQTIARLEATVGSSWMDEGRPKEAEAAFLRAADRLSAFEDELKERAASGEGGDELKLPFAAAIASARSQRADVLLSLAVNANVRERDPEKALAWFERAYELKQNDFMRVLLACYRARSGRADEARAVLAEVAPTPALYYNLACTHALLGERALALDYLARELSENQPSERGRARQAAWAREDPDLASLRGDPRFERLVGG